MFAYNGHGPAQVLVVEDDDAARELLASALRLTGYQVRTAEDGLGGLRLLEAYSPDVVVLDLLLPIANGFEVLEEIRSSAATKHTPVIAISGLEGAVQEARENPDFFATLPKPFYPEALVRIVSRAIHQAESVQSVTHPSDADFTSRTYFANTPLVARGGGAVKADRRAARS